MKVSARALFATTTLAAVTALHACGGDKDPASESPPPAGTAAPAPTGDKNTIPPGTKAVDASVGAPPATCAFLEKNAGLAPEIEPSCKACVAEKCCTQIAKCYGGPPASGIPGAPPDGGKSACALFGECEGECFVGSDGGSALEICENACRAQFGDEAANTFIAAGTCLYEPAPQGCACP
jgi:hypothetical protein